MIKEDRSTTQELPSGWVEAEIGELCSLINGRAFKPTEWSENGLPIIRIQNLNNTNASFNHYCGEYSNKHLVKKYDLLFAWSGTPGTSFGAHIWKGDDALLNQHIFKIIFDTETLSKSYFRLAINHKLIELIGKAHGGVGLRHVTKGKFEKTRIDLPPFSEQTRIVAAIEPLQQRSAKARTLLTEVELLIDKLRQSILQSVFSGRLTADWRAKNPDVEPAEQLLDRIRVERRQRWEDAELAKFEEKKKKPPKGWREKYKEPEPVDETDLPELPKGWCWCNFGDAFEVMVGATPSRKEETYWGGAIPWVSSGEVAFCRINRTKETITQLGLLNSRVERMPYAARRNSGIKSVS